MQYNPMSQYYRACREDANIESHPSRGGEQDTRERPPPRLRIDALSCGFPLEMRYRTVQKIGGMAEYIFNEDL